MGNVELNAGGVIGALLGGGIAAVVVFSVIDTGPGQDIERGPIKLIIFALIVGAFAGNFLWGKLVKKDKPRSASRKDCEQLICHVAKATVVDTPTFRSRAKAAAAELGPASVGVLESLFHSEHSPPKELESDFPGLGQWIAARQFAIFEIYYHLPEESYPILRRVAFGEYDWTQGNAIEVLCRLAADGFRTEEIVAEVRREFPSLRYEAQMYAIGPLLEQAKTDTKIADVLQRFDDLEDYREVVDELREAT